MSPVIRFLIRLAPVVGISALAVVPAEAIPRFSARYEQHCNLCHVNPTGGGQRTLYAAQFLVPSEMALIKTKQEDLEKIDPRIGKNLTVGLDLRTLYHRDKHGEAGYMNFLEMQGTVYLTAQLNDRFLATVERSLTDTPEAYGLGYIFPYHGYIKVGRFIPVYGWRFDDHYMFVRSELGFQPPAHTDVGMEIGFSPQRLAVTLDILNGNRGSILDNNDKSAYAGQALYRLHLGPLGIGVGGSYATNFVTNGWVTARGPYGYFKAGPVAWEWETDWLGPNSPASAGAHHRTEWITSHELSLAATPGIDLVATYDFLDPDIKSTTGTRSRIGGGVQGLIYLFLNLQAMVEHYRYESNPASDPSVLGTSYTQLELQVQFLY